jgi:hypothetical protein
MIEISVNRTSAFCERQGEPLTTRRVGLEAHFDFSQDWDGLLKMAVVQGSGTTLGIMVSQGDTITIPYECLATAGSKLIVGVRGVSEDTTVVIPTVYTTVGIVQRGAMLDSGAEDSSSSLALYDQLMLAAQTAVDTANEALKATTPAVEQALLHAEEAEHWAYKAADAEASAAAAQKAADQAQAAIDIIAGLAQTPLPVVISATQPAGPALWFDTSRGTEQPLPDDDDGPTMDGTGDEAAAVMLDLNGTEADPVSVSIDGTDYAVADTSVGDGTDSKTTYSFEIL